MRGMSLPPPDTSSESIALNRRALDLVIPPPSMDVCESAYEEYLNGDGLEWLLDDPIANDGRESCAVFCISMKF